MGVNSCFCTFPSVIWYLKLRVWSGNTPFHIAECHAVNGLREGGRLLLRLLSIVDGVSVR